LAKVISAVKAVESAYISREFSASSSKLLTSNLRENSLDFPLLRVFLPGYVARFNFCIYLRRKVIAETNIIDNPEFGAELYS